MAPPLSMSRMFSCSVTPEAIDIALNPDHVWTGTLESNEITLEIVPTRQ